MNQDEKHLVLDQVLEREISLYNFENAMSRISMEAQRSTEDAQRRFEDAQRRFEDAQSRFEDAQSRFEESQRILISIQQSRIWRYSSLYRKIGGKIKSLLKSSAFGRLLLKILKRLLG